MASLLKSSSAIVPFYIVGDQCCLLGRWFPMGGMRWVNISLFRVSPHSVVIKWIRIWVTNFELPQPTSPRWAPAFLADVIFYDSFCCSLCLSTLSPWGLNHLQALLPRLSSPSPVLGMAAPTHIIQISVHMSPQALPEHPIFSITCP